MFDFIYNTQICHDLISQAPVGLILYSHIPSMAIALLIGILVFVKNKTLLGKLLFAISFSFVLWTLADLVTWLSTNSIATTFTWSLFGIFTASISILCFYFFYVYLFKKDFSILMKIVIFLPLAHILLLTPTVLNIEHFNLVSCEAVDNINFVTSYYFIGGLSMTGILALAIFGWKKVQDTSKKEIVLMTIGLELFLFAFLSLGYMSSYFDNYSIEFYGLFGMVVFMSFLAYLIVKYKTFDIKMIASQALVWSLIIVIGSQFAFVQNETNKILTAVTLVISGAVGLIIIRSVKKEVALREELEIVNAGQTNLIHIMNHQIKGYLCIDKNIFAELMTDDYGKIPETAKSIISKGFESSDKGTRYVTDILKGASAENGTLPYSMEKIDFKKVVVSEIEAKKQIIEKKNIKLVTDISEGNFNMVGDSILLSEAIRDLIENSIYYTSSGTISIFLKQKAGKFLFTIKDTGVGIKESDRAKLFKAGGVGANSIKINTNSSGYGLAFVKGVVEKHRGKVWFESAGEEKGSTFFVELPVK